MRWLGDCHTVCIYFARFYTSPDLVIAASAENLIRFVATSDYVIAFEAVKAIDSISAEEIIDPGSSEDSLVVRVTKPLETAEVAEWVWLIGWTLLVLCSFLVDFSLVVELASLWRFEDVHFCRSGLAYIVVFKEVGVRCDLEGD